MAVKLCKKKKSYALVDERLSLSIVFNNITELEAIDAEEDLSYELVERGNESPDFKIFEIGACGERVRSVEY